MNLRKTALATGFAGVLLFVLSLVVSYLVVEKLKKLLDSMIEEEKKLGAMFVTWFFPRH